MTSYPQSSYLPNTQQSAACYYTSPRIEGNYFSSVPLEIPCARDRDRNLLIDDLTTSPLASPPDWQLDRNTDPGFWTTEDITAVLFGDLQRQKCNYAPSHRDLAAGLEPASVLSSSWPGDSGATDGGYLSVDTQAGSLSTSQSDLSGGLSLETSPSDVGDVMGGVYSPNEEMLSPFLSPYLSPFQTSYQLTTAPHNTPHSQLFEVSEVGNEAGGEVNSHVAYDNDHVPKQYPSMTNYEGMSKYDGMSKYPMNESSTKTPILDLLMSNPAMWKQATLSKKGTYVCSHCTSQGNHRKFTNLASLAAHFDHHQVMRLCKCDYPNCVWSLIGFSSMPEKVRHLRSQHSNKHYKCGACQRAFLRGDSLKRHLRLVHGREQTSAAEINEMTVMKPFEPSQNATTSCKSPPAYEPVFEFLSLTP